MRQTTECYDVLPTAIRLTLKRRVWPAAAVSSAAMADPLFRKWVGRLRTMGTAEFWRCTSPRDVNRMMVAGIMWEELMFAAGYWKD